MFHDHYKFGKWMNLFTTGLSEPSLISFVSNIYTRLPFVLHYSLHCALKINNIYIDTAIVDPKIWPCENKRGNRWTVSLLIYLNNKSLSEEYLMVLVFHGTPFGKPSSCHKSNYFNSETSWEFLCAINSRPCSKWGLVDYK